MDKITAYIGLLREDGTEPSPASGYARVRAGEVPILALPGILTEVPVAFREATAPGFGVITDIAVFDCPEGGEPLWLIRQPAAQDVREGVVPFIRHGQLYRGVDVSAKVILKSVNAADAVKI